ncbi:hypothetical protein CGLO_13064 [Colletotrichum gloeosporioides Cg-14]|nr:hypothetical protein CGLO_13064 [Colletotrichum gloeosporioides Cg-14]
MPIQSQ